jgi:hypothetical protein
MTMTTVDLRAEAAAEAGRLARARAMVRDGDERALAQLEGDAAWILLGGRTRLRRSLGRRLCLVWRVAIADASGRLVDSRTAAVLVEVPHIAAKPARRAWIRSLLRQADERVRVHVDAHGASWRQEAAAVAAAFASARGRRELAIAGRAVALAHAASQPGLFDRRVERRHQARAAEAGVFERAFAERLRAIGDPAAIVAEPARLLLVLVP